MSEQEAGEPEGGKVIESPHLKGSRNEPEVAGGNEWRLVIDTNQPDLEGEPAFAFGQAYAVTARSLLLLELEQNTSSQ